MKCKYCGHEMVIEAQHAYETIWVCKNPNCPHLIYTGCPHKFYDRSGEHPQPPFYNTHWGKPIYNNDVEAARQNLIEQENRKEEDD